MAVKTFTQLADNIGKVIKGQAETTRKLLIAFVTGGHVLLEDFPGTGKTTLAKALAVSVDVDFQRVQFTPDLLPTDILGVSIYDQQTQNFRFHQGPIFTSVLLADEINRASPRTQSALLESMAEAQISLDGKLHHLDELFFVVATQNPIEFHGTYPLPEAQMDRFAMRLSLGYVSPQEEVNILSDQNSRHPLDDLQACVSRAEILALRAQIAAIRVSAELKRYMVDLVGATRIAEGVQMGASPRASLTLMKSAQALALWEGEEFVRPEHVQQLAVPIIAHRLVLDSQLRFSGTTAERLVEQVLRDTPVPR
jgi:MoxR-like ATPase